MIPGVSVREELEATDAAAEIHPARLSSSLACVASAPRRRGWKGGTKKLDCNPDY